MLHPAGPAATAGSPAGTALPNAFHVFMVSQRGGKKKERIKIDCKALHYPPPHTPTPGICGFFNWVFFLHISHMVASAVIHLYGNVLVIFSF